MDVRVGPQRKLSTEELMIFNCGVGEKILKSPLNCEEIKPVNPKGTQSWIFIGRTDGWSWSSNTLATWCKELTHLKRPWCWERLKAGGEGDDRGWDGWMVSPTRWTWVWVSSGSWWWRGKPGIRTAVHGFAKSQTQLSDWTDLNWYYFRSTFITNIYIFKYCLS